MLLRFAFSLLMTSSFAMAQDSSVACIQSVCGQTPKASATIPVQQMILGQSITGQTLKRPISNYMGRVIHQAMIRDQAFRAFLAMNKFPEIEEDMKGLINAMLYLQNMGDGWKAEEVDSAGKYILNADKLKQVRPSLTETERQAIMSFSPFLQDLIVTGGYFKNYAFPVALKLAFGQNMSLKDAQIKIANETLQTFEKMGARFPILQPFIFLGAAVKKAQSGETLSTAEQAALSDAYQNVGVLNMLSDENVIHQFKRLPLDIPAAQIAARNKFESSQLKTLFDNKPSIKAMYQEAYGKCMTYMGYSYAALPTRAQISKFQSLIPAIEKQAKDLIEERKHASIGSSFGVEYQFPTAQEDLIANVSKFFETKTVDLDQTLKTKIDLNSKDGFQIGLFLVLTYTDKKVLDEAVKLCEQSLPSPLDDANFTSIGVVRVSRSSILSPEIGVPVVAHELGHAIAARFPQDITEEWNCLKAVQGVDLYVGEDFADLFSAEVVKRMGYRLNEISVDSLGCAVAPSSGDAFVSGSLKNANATDTHSSGLYRIMTYSVMTKGLTPQCQKVLDEASETRFANYCRWK